MAVIIKKGDQGSAVNDLQRQLNKHGARLTVDGWFGDATESAVATIQHRAGLVVDGIAGPKTLAALRGEDYSRFLKELDLKTAAARLGIELASIKAVTEVESRGSGFLDDGRPVILLERHVAYRQAKSAGMPVATLAQHYPNLVNPKRGGYAGGAAEWARFDNLRSVTSQQIAIEASSWGFFQVMGAHWKDIGYASADAFQQCMTLSEGSQLEAFVRFIEANPAAHKALKDKKWETFARLYNGPAYKDNLYDVKMARAYDRYQRAAA